MSYAQRAAHPCIGPERADLVIAGCAILSALCRLWPAQRLRVADRGLREGMLYAMIHGVQAPEGRWAPEPESD
jgi:exopolyphosphatase/guanosine-5'-triphosphate,3'-diphosphate pyrophosphatase